MGGARADFVCNYSRASVRLTHLDPLSRAIKYNPDGSFPMTVKQINAISPILLPKIELSDREVNYLVAFLSSVHYQPNDLDAIIPKPVLSGLPRPGQLTGGVRNVDAHGPDPP